MIALESLRISTLVVLTSLWITPAWSNKSKHLPHRPPTLEELRRRFGCQNSLTPHSQKSQLPESRLAKKKQIIESLTPEQRRAYFMYGRLPSETRSEFNGPPNREKRHQGLVDQLEKEGLSVHLEMNGDTLQRFRSHHGHQEFEAEKLDAALEVAKRLVIVKDRTIEDGAIRGRATKMTTTLRVESLPEDFPTPPELSRNTRIDPTKGTAQANRTTLQINEDILRNDFTLILIEYAIRIIGAH